MIRNEIGAINTLGSSRTLLTAKGTRTRQRIVSAAAELMFAHGVPGTTMEDVRSAAKVSSSQLYHYFSDKQDLVRAVVAHHTHVIVGNQEQADLESLEAIRAWRDAIVALVRSRQCRGGCPLGSLGSELAETDTEARLDVATGFTQWEAAIQGGLRAMQVRGHLTPDADPDALALATLAALQGGLLLAQVQRDTKPLEVALDAMIMLIGLHTAPLAATHPRRSHDEQQSSPSLPS